jgi:hypothetical protein
MKKKLFYILNVYAFFFRVIVGREDDKNIELDVSKHCLNLICL